MPLEELLLYTQHETEHMWQIPEEELGELYFLLKACLELDPAKRATVKELLEGSGFLGNDTVQYIDSMAEVIQEDAFRGVY